MARGVDVVLNRNARQLRGQSPLAACLAAAARRGGARVHETRDLDELRKAAMRIAEIGTDAVILAGGDGSCMAGVSALSHAFGQAALPAVTLAPAGTVGTIARNVGSAKAGPERAIDLVCSGAARSVRWPTLRVDDETGRTHVGFIFGAGLAQRFFEVYDRSERGVGAAAAIVGRLFAGSVLGSSFARHVLEPIACTVALDGRIQTASRYSVLVASVVRDVGLHLLLTYRAAEEHGRFHVVGSGLPPEELGPQMPRVLAGRPLRGEPRIDALASSLRIDFAANDGGYVLDGEIFRARCARVSAGPVLTLQVPP
jgi:diacylglycerol kinase family enzyme